MRCCAEHDDLMLELALGELGNEDALRAEAIRSRCEMCRSWWATTFDEARTAEVDAGVARAFAEFVPPVRAQRWWWTVAASAVLAIGVGVAAVLWWPGQQGSLAEHHVSPSGALISTWNFEMGDEALSSAPAGRAGSELGAPERDAVVTVLDFEAGDLSGLTSSDSGT